MIHKVNVVKKIAFLLMTMALAGAIVACQGTVTSPATVAKEIGDIEFDVGGSAKKIPLTGHFNVTNPEYSATSSKESVAAVSVSGAVLTVTPKGAGTANVEVTADGDEGKVSQTFTVTVNAPTVIVNKAPTVRTISPVSLQVAGTKTIELSDYFTDPEGDALTYTAASSDDSVATVTDPGAASTITITAVAAGPAEITVSASDGTNDAVSRTFTVTVTASGGVNERPEQTLIADINDLRREGTRDLDLSMYYDDPDGDDLTFDATSSDEMVVTESVSGSMLTITGFGVGRARISVIASDGTDDVRQSFSVTVGSQAPVVDESLPTRFPLGLAGATKVLNLSKYYDDPEGDDLTYDATSSDEMVVTESVSGSMLTITAVAPGEAVVTATATDKDNDPVALEFVVTVGAPPVVNEPPRVIAGMVDDKILVVGDTTPLTLSDYFTDPDEGDTLSYSARSSDNTIAMVTDPDVVDHTITITAVGVGEAVITIGATDNHEVSTGATFTVTVGPANNPPTRTSGIAAPDEVSLVLEDEPSWTHDVSRYFMDADDDTLTYTPLSSMDMYATAMIPEGSSMVTITAVAEGMATITVTASDGNDGSAKLMINVTVEPAPVRNMAPKLKAMLGPFKGVAFGYKNIDLDEYFEDPDGNDALITYETKVTYEDPTVSSVIAVRGGSGWDPSDGKYMCTKTSSDGTGLNVIPDGSDIGEDLLGICYQNTGDAEIEIVAIDMLGKESSPVIVMITVGDNENPIVLAGKIEEFTKENRLKVDETKPVIDNKKISGYFSDKNFLSEGVNPRGDTLTFEVKSYPNGTKVADIVMNGVLTDLAPLAADKAQVSTSLLSDWNGDRDSTFTLSVTALRGSADSAKATTDVVAIIATDDFGASAVRTFNVRVNHKPQAYSAHLAEKDRETLADYKEFIGLSAADLDKEFTLVLVKTDAGYFSDKDMDKKLTCYFRTSEANAAAKLLKNVKIDSLNVLSITSTGKLGTMSIAIWCNDGTEDSDEATVYVEFDRGASIAF